jgi:hypothetical protein
LSNLAGVRILVNAYGSPGDVEYKNCSLPETLAKWQETAKKALSEQGGFAEVKEVGASKEALVNVNQVEWVYPL